MERGRIKPLLIAIEGEYWGYSSTTNYEFSFYMQLLYRVSFLSIYEFFFTLNLPLHDIKANGAIFVLFTITLSFAIPYLLASIGDL